jgi:hypothetical protein
MSLLQCGSKTNKYKIEEAKKLQQYSIKNKSAITELVDPLGTVCGSLGVHTPLVEKLWPKVWSHF